MMKVTLNDIKSAQSIIASSVNLTSCDFSRSASKIAGQDVYFKLENTQRTGSYKIRGATHKILSLTPEEKKAGVIACSAGNHAQGVALSSSIHGVKSYIVMPETASLAKVEATKNYGAEVILYGSSFDEAKEHAFQLAKEKGYVFVHPYEDEKVIAGQGTVALEVLEQVKDLKEIIIPVGGGGLISGMSTAIKAINPNIKIIGVQSETVSTMVQLYKDHKYNEINYVVSTLADGIAIKQPSQVMYDSFISKYVDEMVTVSEGQIAEAMVYLLERVKTVAEGSGAVGLAAVLAKKVKLTGKTCIVVTGGNVDMNLVAGAIQHGRLQQGRVCELSVVVSDTPGSLSRLTQILAEHRANILEVHHDRIGKNLGMKETKIEFVIETIDHNHIMKIRKAIEASGARLETND